MRTSSFRRALRGAIEGGLDWVWPADCAFCGRRLGLAPGGWRPLSLLCEDCLLELPSRFPTGPAAGSGFTAARLAYVDGTRPLLLAVKERGDRGLLARLATLWPEPPAGAPGPPDALVPVPSTAARRRERGGDPVLELARCWGRAWNLPCLPLLVRRPSRAQKELGALERAGNLRGAFRVRRPPDRAAARVWLVDDVVTTGATYEACADVLRAVGWIATGRLALFHTPKRLALHDSQAAGRAPVV